MRPCRAPAALVVVLAACSGGRGGGQPALERLAPTAASTLGPGNEGENYLHPSAKTMLSTSSDGLTWSAPTVASGPSPSKTDVFPFLYSDGAGSAWRVLWVNESGVVTMPVGGTFTADISALDIPCYSPRLAPTPTPGIDWVAWVEGTDPNQQVRHRLRAR